MPASAPPSHCAAGARPTSVIFSSHAGRAIGVRCKFLVSHLSRAVTWRAPAPRMPSAAAKPTMRQQPKSIAGRFDPR